MAAGERAIGRPRDNSTKGLSGSLPAGLKIRDAKRIAQPRVTSMRFLRYDGHDVSALAEDARCTARVLLKSTGAP
jgi:hypothetical protein